MGPVLAVVQLQNGKTGALGPDGATLLARADAWLCSVLSVRLLTVRLAKHRCGPACPVIPSPKSL